MMKGVFDNKESQKLACAKKELLQTFLPGLIKAMKLKTCLDAGCGFGYFCGYFSALGLKVSAFDGRKENLEEAAGRFPGVAFHLGNVENEAITDLGSFDIVGCLGLLYHLENPMSAIRNLRRLTKKVCLIETMINPSFSLSTILIEEGKGKDQGLNYLAQIPSERWMIKALYKAGFAFVYRPKCLPEYKDFHERLFKRRSRIVLVASTEELLAGEFKLCAEPAETNRYAWHPFGIGMILDNSKPIRFIKKITNKDKKWSP